VIQKLIKASGVKMEYAAACTGGAMHSALRFTPARSEFPSNTACVCSPSVGACPSGRVRPDWPGKFAQAVAEARLLTLPSGPRGRLCGVRAQLPRMARRCERTSLSVSTATNARSCSCQMLPQSLVQAPPRSMRPALVLALIGEPVVEAQCGAQPYRTSHR